MANKKIFMSAKPSIPATDTVNEAGGNAYSLTPKQALAQLAVTGCFGNTFYVNDEDQLKQVADLVATVNDDEFIAKLAAYSRNEGYMKDMPAFLMASISKKSPALMKRVFPKVINNGKMLRNFVQIVRSGTTGRQSLGSAPKAAVQKYLLTRKPLVIFNDAVGNDPSMADVIKMVHPKPKTPEQAGLFAHILGKPLKEGDILPEVIRQFEDFKAGKVSGIPEGINWQRLTALNLTTKQWRDIARNAPWHMTRMNINTFIRHGVFDDSREGKELVQLVATRLRDKEQILKARVFPYQLMMAFRMTDGAPREIQSALQDAMEVATENIPAFPGQVYVFPDVSGSMSSPVTGFRGTATTSVRCIDVAALVSASVMRKNPSAIVMPFEYDVVPPNRLKLNPRDSVMTNADKLSRIGGGGTNCSAPLAQLNTQKAKGDLLIYVSDNESWMDSPYRYSGTATQAEWAKFKKRNPSAKMVCIDITPYGTVQAKSSSDVLNVGGFSDNVFDVIRKFVDSNGDPDYFVRVIEETEI